jgi:trehalose 6-phosphate phosphatase
VSEPPIERLIEPFAAAPRRSGAFFDLDGTLAPIVERPDRAAVPEATRALLARIAARFAIAGLISGRRAAEARRIAGLEQLTVIGNHGLEILRGGSSEAEPAPGTAGAIAELRDFLAGLDLEALGLLGLRGEDKQAIYALHWRGARDEAGAQHEAERIAERARQAGFQTHRGRKVVELRPAVDFDKGRGLRRLLTGLDLDNILYAGDDRTDVDVFRELGSLLGDGSLRAIARIGVLSEESPDEVREAADLCVEGPEGLIGILSTIAAEVG